MSSIQIVTVFFFQDITWDVAEVRAIVEAVAVAQDHPLLSGDAALPLRDVADLERHHLIDVADIRDHPLHVVAIKPLPKATSL